MKRLAATAAIALAMGVSAFAQTVPSLDSFKTTFDDFAKSLAGTLTLNSVGGSNWSDAYIGAFPHFGAGIVASTAFASSDTPKKIFAAFGAELPAPLDTLGMPVPAIMAAFKIGLPFLPVDVGIKGGYVPPSLGESLKSATGISASYTNVGLTARFALVKQNVLLPNVSIGASYNFQAGSIVAPTHLATPSLSVLGYSVGLTEPDLKLDWTSNTYDFTLQVSKTLLFLLTPYVGAGYTIGTSSISGGLDSSLTTTYPGGMDALKAAMASANMALPFTSTGLSYSATASDPLIRLFGGFSLNLAIIRLDLQAVYVPAMATQAQSVGASFSTILQL